MSSQNDAPQPPQTLTAEAMLRLGRVAQVTPSPCGRWLACEISRLNREQSAYTSELWRVPLEGGSPVPLTWGESRDHHPRFRADGSLLFLSNRDPIPGKAGSAEGREQVWLLPAHGGEPRPVTDEPLGVSTFRIGGGRLALLCPHLPGIAEDAQRATHTDRKKNGPSALRYTEMTVRFWDHWLPEARPRLVICEDNGQGRSVVQIDDHPEALRQADFDLSADGLRLAVTLNHRAEDGVRDRRCLIIDLEGDRRHEIGAAPRVYYEGLAFSPDGRHLATVRHRREEGRVGRPLLWVLSADEVGRFGDEGRAVAPQWDCWPQLQGWSPDGAILASADLRGNVPPFRVPLDGGAPERLIPVEAGGTHQSLHLIEGEGGSTLVGVRSTCRHPPEPFCMAAGDAAPRLLGCLSGLTPEAGEALITVSRMEVLGASGVPVDVFVVTPANAEPDRGALLWIHGGPIAHHGDGWHWRWNAMVGATESRCTLVLPNPRGSTGYGQAFIEGVWDNAWGADCFTDVMAVADAVARLDGVDPQRVALMGGSFGGYMANWIAGHTDRFRCLVSHAGLYRFSAFLGATDEPGWFALQFGGAPHLNEDFERYSPHTRIAHWKTPTMVIHGEKDYRVPIGEALTLFEALQRRGVPSELMIFPDEGHWITRPRNVQAWYDAWLAFVSRHL